MLVLTRRTNESIVIGDDIVVTVLDVKGDQVRIGIRAPRSVPVHREEVYAAVRRANRSASTVQAGDTALIPPPPSGSTPPSTA